MSKDHLERRIYRKSPGRQYGYDYDPLRSSGANSSRSPKGETASRSGMLLAQRPDPRRTRQLMRQSIIASKRPVEDESERIEFNDHHYEGEEEPYGARPSRRPVEHYEDETEAYLPPVQRSNRGIRSSGDLPPTSALYIPEDDEYSDEWHELAAVDPDLGIEEEPLHQRIRYSDEYDEYDDDELAPRAVRSVPVRQRPQAKLTRRLEPEDLDHIYPDEDDKYDYKYEYEEDQPSVRRVKSKDQKKLSRRGLLIGAGAAAVAGVGIAAYELAPKLPTSVGDVSSNIEHQLQDAFNKGVSQGMDQARKEFIVSVENIEGFTLEGAITAARLTRVAYDVFVSPIIKFGATITGDVLSGMLKAFKTARGLLAGIYQDNATLIAIQKVLESWVGQANTLPKQLDAITQSDLDGAQAYLRALQRKVDDEKAKVNQAANATPAANAKPTAQSTKPAK
ncbi:hypothetical protein [Dictyobacter kobayashii]|uniref:Uncharacterized protein n=1 Tax=Dictyobacter kobayashii TaxID=2014872 RepID=A0A402AJG6_9CHLR|nr:hypothetical protein [Dictyobacter kobayashii]GCE19195.1 hypothetical protein KDK_29950 [Dictyobacter kobayashii]